MTDLIENIGLDLVLRTAIFGLAPLLLALIASFGIGFATWRRPPDPAVAVFAP